MRKVEEKIVPITLDKTAASTASGDLDGLLASLGDALIPSNAPILYASCCETVLGPMLAIADQQELYLLEFITRKGLAREIAGLRKQGFALVPGHTAPLQSIASELKAYFAGTLIQFNTPFRMLGTPFQQQVWQALAQIPYGATRSYAEQARSLGKPTAYRAVANANGANQLALIIPCHRIIASNGDLGGYGGGVAMKQWLLQHERATRG